MSRKIDAYKDPNHEGNSVKYLTGKLCIEKGCELLAGTYWSPLLCFDCNVKRIDRIDNNLNRIAKGIEAKDD